LDLDGKVEMVISLMMKRMKMIGGRRRKVKKMEEDGKVRTLERKRIAGRWMGKIRCWS
jgi:hypothetical protein